MASLTTRPRKAGGLSYIVRYTDAAGKERQNTYRDKATANRALKERTAQEVRDELLDTARARQPLEDMARTWLSVVRRSVKDRTALGYEEVLRTHVLPAFGDRRIGSITTEDVDLWVGELIERGLSPKTVRNIYTPLASTMKHAVKVKALRVNPCTGVALPESRDEAPFEGFALDRSQVEMVGAEIAERCEPYGFAAVLLANTGLRAAEFAALRVADLDWSNGTVQVRRTLARNRRTREWTVSTTKNRRERAVPVLDEVVLEALAEYVETHPRGKEPGAPLFYGRATGGHGPDPGKPFDPHVFYQWHFKPAARRVGLPQLRVHDLRHTAATLWHEDGEHLETISRWLGHSSIAVTDSIYIHWRQQQDFEAARERNRAARAAERERSVIPLRQRRA